MAVVIAAEPHYPLYLTDGTAAALYWGVLGVWIAIELVFYVRTMFRRDAQLKDRNSFLIAFGSVLVGFIVSITLVTAIQGAAVTDGRIAVFGAGMAIMVCGVVLRTSAMLLLGRFFTIVVMVGGNQHIIETGPYRWIRHPAYTGGLLGIAGQLLAMTNWVALVGLVPVIAGVLYRISVEERAMFDHFGEGYRSYSRRTKRLIPLVY